MRIAAILFVQSLFIASCLSPNQKLIKNTGHRNGIYALIYTDKGSCIAKLEYEKTPITVANFIGLSQGIIPNTLKPAGQPFYDSLKFYKVFKGYMLLTGCPKNDGRGNPGYFFMDEFHPSLRHSKPGTLSMVNSGPNSNGSQFLITMRASTVMDNKNTVFGYLVSGIEILENIQQGDAIVKIEIVKMGRKAQRFDPMEVLRKNGFERMKKHE